MLNKKIAIAFYGFPGSGKGTQAELSAAAFGLTNFDTGRYLESLWYDPERQHDPVVQKERKIFEAGKLNTPEFVLGEVARAVTAIAKSGRGVVFSGSPRTMHEAERLTPLLERLYGKKGVFFFFLDVRSSDSVERNGKRLLCTFCKVPLLMKYIPSKHPKFCPRCGASLYRRTLDRKDIIVKRIAEYKERTEPVVRYLKKRGYRVTMLDGRPAPYKIFELVQKEIARRMKS